MSCFNTLPVRITLTCLIGLFTTVCTAGKQERLAALVEQTLDESGIPAMAVAVSNTAGETVLAVQGERTAGSGFSVEPDDAFHIGSVAKNMTALLAARQVDAGRLSWSTRVLEVFPEHAQAADPAYRDLTLGALLSHTSGMAALTAEEDIQALPDFPGDLMAKRRALAGWLLEQPPVFTPGSGSHYSNGAVVAAAAMVETVTGQSWEALMRSQIFEALDLRQAGFGWPGRNHHLDQPVLGHRELSGNFSVVDPNGDYQIPELLAPSGDVHMSAGELAHYATEWLQIVRGKNGLLSSSTAASMIERDGNPGIGWGVQAGFGHDRILVYVGSAGTFMTYLVLIPEIDRAFVVTSNASGESADAITLRLLHDVIDSFGD